MRLSVIYVKTLQGQAIKIMNHLNDANIKMK